MSCLHTVNCWNVKKKAKLSRIKARIKLKPDAQPVYQKSRPVPYSNRENVEREYDRFIRVDIWHEKKITVNGHHLLFMCLDLTNPLGYVVITKL